MEGVEGRGTLAGLRERGWSTLLKGNACGEESSKESELGDKDEDDEDDEDDDGVDTLEVLIVSRG